jgi:hypothetical protein
LIRGSGASASRMAMRKTVVGLLKRASPLMIVVTIGVAD